MKRSEMIAFMNSAYDYALNSDYKEHRENPMSYVLQVMEEEGMRRPKWKGINPGHFPGDEHEFEMECWEEDYYYEEK